MVPLADSSLTPARRNERPMRSHFIPAQCWELASTRSWARGLHTARRNQRWAELPPHLKLTRKAAILGKSAKRAATLLDSRSATVHRRLGRARIPDCASALQLPKGGSAGSVLKFRFYFDVPLGTEHLQRRPRAMAADYDIHEAATRGKTSQHHLIEKIRQGG